MRSGEGTLVPLVILFLVWIPIVTWTVIGTIRSAIRAFANWCTHKIEALGGVVAIATFLAALYYIGRDISALISSSFNVPWRRYQRRISVPLRNCVLFA